MQLLIDKAKKIKLVIFDVDGVLTSGQLIYNTDGSELKTFNVLDGHGMKMLQSTGIQVGIITSRQSEAVAKRMYDLKIMHLYQGQQDKVTAYEDLKQKLKFTDEQIAYVGDDLPDLPLLRRVGFAISVANGINIVKDHADWITTQEGGRGAAREVCEFIMHAQDTYQNAIDAYLKR